MLRPSCDFPNCDVEIASTSQLRNSQRPAIEIAFMQQQSNYALPTREGGCGKSGGEDERR
jgi:hypothetical protein